MSDQSELPDLDETTIKRLSKMRCPKCGERLDQIEHHDVPIERCPGCFGIWLDAGELELISLRERTHEGGWISGLMRVFKEKDRHKDEHKDEAGQK